jgi:hypothetical protein
MASHRWPAVRAAPVSRTRSASGTWYQESGCYDPRLPAIPPTSPLIALEDAVIANEPCPADVGETRALRGTLSPATRASCTDSTGNRTGGTRGVLLLYVIIADDMNPRPRADLVPWPTVDLVRRYPRNPVSRRPNLPNSGRCVSVFYALACISLTPTAIIHSGLQIEFWAPCRIFTLVCYRGREVVCVQILHLWPAAGLADVHIVPGGPFPPEGAASAVAQKVRHSHRPGRHRKPQPGSLARQIRRLG